MPQPPEFFVSSQLSRALGLLMCATAPVAIIVRLIISVPLPLLPLVFYMVLQALLGVFLAYASQLKLRGELLSHKLYPASLGATTLYTLMLVYWLAGALPASA